MSARNPPGAPATPGNLLNEEQYRRYADHILCAFDGVTTHRETRLVIASRLRETLERFIAREGGADWDNLIKLMCALQDLKRRELLAVESATITKGGGK